MTNTSTISSTISATPNVITIQKRTDGQWEARRLGAPRALRVTSTQKAAENLGRQIARSTGARLTFRNASGALRVK